MAAPAGVAAVAASAPMPAAAGADRSSERANARRSVAAFPAVDAQAAVAPVAAAPACGQNRQRADELADRDVRELGGASGPAVRSAGARLAVFPVATVLGIRLGLGEQLLSENRRMRVRPHAAGTVEPVAAGLAARAMQRPRAGVDRERRRQNAEPVGGGRAGVGADEPLHDEDQQVPLHDDLAARVDHELPDVHGAADVGDRSQSPPIAADGQVPALAAPNVLPEHAQRADRKREEARAIGCLGRLERPLGEDERLEAIVAALAEPAAGVDHRVEEHVCTPPPLFWSHRSELAHVLDRRNAREGDQLGSALELLDVVAKLLRAPREGVQLGGVEARSRPAARSARSLVRRGPRLKHAARNAPKGPPSG